MKLCTLHVPFAFLVFSFTATGCSSFKTRYEEIPPRFPPSISVLDEIDPKWKFRSLDGDTLALAAFKGKKMFINFWATWCAPCLAEMPGLQSLYDTFKSDTTYAFFFISDEDEKTVRSFLWKSTYTLPVYLCDNMRAPRFNTGAYPSTFIVNSRGQIVYEKLETAKWNHESVIDFLNGLP